jgi:hypothetical protein
MARPLWALCLAIAWSAAPVTAQRIVWRTDAALYGDNTEFFTPFRTGETILGKQLTTWLAAMPSDRLELRLGLFADARTGSESYADTIIPVVSVRYQTDRSLGVLGTLETLRRHGLLEPLMVTTRELTTPIEGGIQWIERRGRVTADAWINWQKLNTTAQREQFELGVVADVALGRGVTAGLQHLWSHRGGQLHDAGVPVSNNRVTALGLRWADSVPLVRAASLATWRLQSEGHIDPDYPTTRPGSGHGTYLRAGITPWRDVEVFGIWWRGRDFVANAGDNNYNSTGQDPDFYRSARRYTELGVQRRVEGGGGTQFDAELRFHRIDNEPSEAFFNTPWELSYRVIVRVPVTVGVR